MEEQRGTKLRKMKALMASNTELKSEERKEKERKGKESGSDGFKFLLKYCTYHLT